MKGMIQPDCIAEKNEKKQTLNHSSRIAFNTSVRLMRHTVTRTAARDLRCGIIRHNSRKHFLRRDRRRLL